MQCRSGFRRKIQSSSKLKWKKHVNDVRLRKENKKLNSQILMTSITKNLSLMNNIVKYF